MLKELKFVMGAVSKKDFIPAMTHFRIENGKVRGFNGTLALCSPIPFDIDCTPKADVLVRAIQHCEETVTMTMTAAGRLSIKSGAFKAFIDCVPGETQHIEPSGKEFKLDGEAFLRGIKTCIPFVSDDASRPWSNGVLLRGQSAFATNNIVLVQYWMGAEFPFECCIPLKAVKEIARIDEAPTHGQWDDHRITFHYSDGRWVSTALLSTTWPDLESILNADSKPIPVEDSVFGVLAKLKPFADKLGRVYFNEQNASTTLNPDEGASVQHMDIPQAGVYQIEMLSLLQGIAERIDWTLYPRPCMFYGDRLRGAIVGMRT